MQKKPTNPLVISVFGLMLIVFGIVDIIYVNRLIGTALLSAGIYLGILGIIRYQALKKKLRR